MSAPIPIRNQRNCNRESPLFYTDDDDFLELERHFGDLRHMNPTQTLQVPSLPNLSLSSSTDSKRVTFREFATVHEVSRYLLNAEEQKELDERIKKYGGKTAYKIGRKLQKWLSPKNSSL
jgi:hypothetical protein